MVGCLSLSLELVLIANTSGPRDSVLYEYCDDQVDSLESALELLARELRVDLELTLEFLEPMLELLDRLVLMLELLDRVERPLTESLAFLKLTNGDPMDRVLLLVSLLETSRRWLRRESPCLPLVSRLGRSLDFSRSL